MKNKFVSAQLMDEELNSNSSFIEVNIGNKRHKIKRLNNWASAKITKLVLKGELLLSDDKKDTMVSFNENRLLVPKCLSIALLASWWKILMFHWIYWRYLNIKYSQKDYRTALFDILNFSDITFFFVNMASLQKYVTHEQEMTSQTTLSITQNQKQEQQVT